MSCPNRFTHLIRFVLLCIVILAIALPKNLTMANPDSAPPEGYRKLQPISIFKDKLLGTWSCNIPDCDLNAPKNQVPIDQSSDGMYNGLPSIKIEIREAVSNSWLVILSGPNWNSRSLEHYAATGFLTFNVKGLVGGEDMLIKLTDVVPGRNPNNQNVQVKLSDFIAVTTQWQEVSIPLSAFNFASNAAFNLRQVRDLRFEEAKNGPYAKTIWVNNIRYTSPAIEPGYPAIKVNQVGYVAKGEKYALVSGFAEDLPADLTTGTEFNIVNVSDDKAVFTGKLELVTGFDPLVSGEKIFRADFSSFTNPGNYYLTVNIATNANNKPALISGVKSLPFKIDNKVYQTLLFDATRYFFFQRQGLELTAKYAGMFARPLGHPQDSSVKLRSDIEAKTDNPTLFDVSQGWYDAGDYGKYVAYTANAVDQLLAAYELYPSQFPDSQLNIPESGNGVSDLLDEIRWELDWVLKMQDPTDGGFYERVYSNNDSASPHTGKTQRYIEDLVGGKTPRTKPTRATALAAAYLARASRVYRSTDAVYADKMLKAARSAWEFLKKHPTCEPTTWPSCDPKGVFATDDQNRLWAAAELFRATGDKEFNTYYLENYASQRYVQIWESKTDNAGAPSLRAFIAYCASPNADATAKAWFVEKFNAWREGQLDRVAKSPWRNFLNDGADGRDSDYYWGSNAVTLETIVILAQGSQIAGNYDQRVIQAAYAQLGYILGLNPIRKSYVSGQGGDSIDTVFSSIYSNDGIPQIPPGYMAEGPNRFDGAVFSKFDGKNYAPTNSDWTTSEHALYYNSTLVFSTALALYEANR